MQMLEKNKKIVVTILLLVLVMVFYNLFFKTDYASLESLDTSSVGADILKISQDLRAVNLDQSLLTSAGYLLLVDFSRPIVPQAKGRENPFDPI